MLKRFLPLVVTISLFSAAVASPVSAATKAEKVKAGIARLGTGTAAHIEVKLKDRTKLKGYIGEAGEDDFSVVDANTGAVTRVTYGQVQKVKGNNLSTGAKIAIGLGVLAGVLLILLIFENYG